MDHDPLEARQVERREAVDEPGVAHEHAGAGLAEDVLQQRAALRRVHRDLDARRPRDAEPHGDELRDVGHHDRDAIARLDPPAAQGAGEAPAPGLQLADGHVAAAAPEQRVRPVPLDGRVEHAGQRRGQRFHAPD